jgi:hypothetical protein
MQEATRERGPTNPNKSMIAIVCTTTVSHLSGTPKHWLKLSYDNAKTFAL